MINFYNNSSRFPQDWIMQPKFYKRSPLVSSRKFYFFRNSKESNPKNQDFLDPLKNYRHYTGKSQYLSATPDNLIRNGLKHDYSNTFANKSLTDLIKSQKKIRETNIFNSTYKNQTTTDKSYNSHIQEINCIGTSFKNFKRTDGDAKSLSFTKKKLNIIKLRISSIENLEKNSIDSIMSPLKPLSTSIKSIKKKYKIKKSVNVISHKSQLSAKPTAQKESTKSISVTTPNRLSNSISHHKPK
jgi:hypothetical protein